MKGSSPLQLEPRKALLCIALVCLLAVPWIAPQLDPQTNFLNLDVPRSVAPSEGVNGTLDGATGTPVLPPQLVSPQDTERGKGKDSPVPTLTPTGYYDLTGFRFHAPVRDVTATRNLLVILVEYTDETHSFTPAQIETVAIDTLDAYYNEISFGLQRVTGDTTAWLQLGNDRENYVSGTSYPSDPRFNLIVDAINAADPYVNYNDYDDVTIVHAGQGQESSWDWRDYWSCSWHGFSLSTDERTIHRASVSPEESTSGSLAKVGVIAHEYGHDLGLPDLYDYSSQEEFVGKWGLMASGCWNQGGSSPAHMVGWCKTELGYVTGAQLVEVAGEITTIVDPLETSTTGVHLLKIPVTTLRYYLVEVRQQLGYDAYLPDKGVLLTYIDESLSSGHGIVTVIDAHPSTSTKDDAAFDVGAGEVSYYMSATHEFTMVIEEAVGTSYNISIYRAFVTFDNLPDGATIHTASFNVQWTGMAAPPGINCYELYLDDALEYTGLNTDFTLTGLTEAPHNVTLSMILNDAGRRLTITSLITVALDNQPPTWVNPPTDQFLVYGEELALQLEAYDPSGIASWSVDDTTHFTINSTGYLESQGVLNPGSYELRISVADLYGNTRSATITVVVSLPITQPLILLVTITAIILVIFVLTVVFLYRHRRGV